MCTTSRTFSSLTREEKAEIQHAYHYDGIKGAVKRINLALGYPLPHKKRLECIREIVMGEDFSLPVDIGPTEVKSDVEDSAPQPTKKRGRKPKAKKE